MTSNVKYHKNDGEDVAIAEAEEFASDSWRGFALSINNSLRESEATNPRNHFVFARGLCRGKLV